MAMWNCPSCTLDNEASAVKCAACDAPRPTRPQPSMDVPVEAHQRSASDAEDLQLAAAIEASRATAQSSLLEATTDPRALARAIAASTTTAARPSALIEDTTDPTDLAQAISASIPVARPATLVENTTDPTELARAISASVACPATIDSMSTEQRTRLAIDKSLATKRAEDAERLTAARESDHALQAAIAVSQAEYDATEARRLEAEAREEIQRSLQEQPAVTIVPTGMPLAPMVTPVGGGIPVISPIAAPQQTRMCVEVPEGLEGGMVMQVHCGAAGLCNVQIPVGYVAGQVFEFVAVGV